MGCKQNTFIFWARLDSLLLYFLSNHFPCENILLALERCQSMSEWERGPAYKYKMGDSVDSGLELGHYFYRFIFCRREGNDAN